MVKQSRKLANRLSVPRRLNDTNARVNLKEEYLAPRLEAALGLLTPYNIS